MTKHADFDAAFRGGRFGEHLVCSSRRLGAIRLASGRVVVRDPYDDGEGRWVVVDGLPAGTFPVDVAVARDARFERDAVAALRVVFADEPVSRWEVQRAEYDRPRPPFEVSGHDVLSGLTQVADANSRADAGDVERGRDVVTRLVPPDAPAAAIVSAGYGERNRTYSTYLGRDARGAVVALAVDFEVLTQPVYESVALDLPLPIGRIDDARFALVGVEAWATSATDLELRGDVARICIGRVGDPLAAPPIEPRIETRPAFLQRFAFGAATGRAFVKLYLGQTNIERREQ